MIIKNLENKIKLVIIVTGFVIIGCVIISISSIVTATNMVIDSHKKIYVLDGNVPILVSRTTMDETIDVEARSHIEMFHHFFLRWHLMTNISNIRWKKRCIWWMKQGWLNTIP